VPDLEAVFDELMPGLWTLATQMGILDGWAGFDYQGDGEYTTRPDAKQLLAGYSDFYDLIFDVVTDTLFRKFPFTYGGDTYTFWVWKGDYMNLGAGAEIGFYVRDGVGAENGAWWSTVANADAPEMSVNLSGSHGTIASYEPDAAQAWVGAFDSRTQDARAASLTADYTITFDNDEMYTAFREDWGDDTRWGFTDETRTATLRFRRKRRRAR
jgi:hypothetical protein